MPVEPEFMEAYLRKALVYNFSSDGRILQTIGLDNSVDPKAISEALNNLAPHKMEDNPVDDRHYPAAEEELNIKANEKPAENLGVMGVREPDHELEKLR